MNRDIRFLDSRMFKRVYLLYYPKDLTDMSDEYFKIDGSRIVKGSFNLTETVNTGDEWKPGLPNKSVLRVKIHLGGLNYSLSAGDMVEVLCETNVPPSTDYDTRKITRLGCFEVDSLEKNENSELYDLTAYSFGFNSAQDALKDMELKKMQFGDLGKTVNYNLPIDALALESFGYTFNGLSSMTNILKTGDSNRTIARFDRNETGWKSLVMDFEFYQTGNFDKGWLSLGVYQPRFAMDGINEALDAIQEYFDACGFGTDALNLLYNAMYAHYSYDTNFPASIVNNSTTEMFEDEMLGQSINDILIKPYRYIYGYQPTFETMPGSTCIIIPTGVSIWQISGTGRTKSATRLYQKTITRRRALKLGYLRNSSDYITLTSIDREAFDDITAESLLNAYCEFRGIKLINNRLYSKSGTDYDITLSSKEFTGIYDDSLLFPSEELHPSRTLYPASGSDVALIPVGREMILSLKMDDSDGQHRYGKAIIPDYSGEEVTPVEITGITEINVDSYGKPYIYDRTYNLLENIYIKVKGYTVNQIKSQLSSNGFWTRMSRVPDNPKCTLKATGLPFVEAGEFVAIYNGEQNNKFVPLMVSQRTMRGEQGMTDEITTKPLQKTI